MIFRGFIYFIYSRFCNIIFTLSYFLLLNNVFSSKAHSVSGAQAPVHINATNFFVTQMTLANKLDNPIPVTEMSFILSLLSNVLADQPKDYILKYKGYDNDAKAIQKLETGNFTADDFNWNIPYIGRDGDIQVFESPVLNLHTLDIAWYYSIFEHLYNQNREEFIYFLHNIDLIETMKMWLKNIEKNTADKTNLAISSKTKLEIFSRGPQANDRDVKAMIQALIDSYSYLPYQRDMLSNRIGDYTKSITNQEAEDLYKKLIDGRLSENERNNIIAGSIITPNGISFAFDTRTIISDIIEFFESDPNYLLLLKASQNFTVEMMSLKGNASYALSPNDMFDKIKRIEQLYRALEMINMLLRLNSGFFQDIESLTNYCENHYILMPANPELLIKLGSNREIWSVLEAVFESYDWKLDESEKFTVFSKFTSLLNIYSYLQKNDYIKTHTLRRLMKNMNAINVLQKNTKKYYLMIPKDYKEALSYTVFADTVPIKQKLTVLSMMGVFTSWEALVISNRVNHVKLSRGYDYYTFGDEYEIQSDITKLPELGNKTIKEFINELCKDPRSKTISGLNGMNLWDIWLDFVTMHYEAMEKTWDNPDSSILNLLFNDSEKPVMFDNIPMSGQILGQVHCFADFL